MSSPNTVIPWSLLEERSVRPWLTTDYGHFSLAALTNRSAGPLMWFCSCPGSVPLRDSLPQQTSSVPPSLASSESFSSWHNTPSSLAPFRTSMGTGTAANWRRSAKAQPASGPLSPAVGALQLQRQRGESREVHKEHNVKTAWDHGYRNFVVESVANSQGGHLVLCGLTAAAPRGCLAMPISTLH